MLLSLPAFPGPCQPSVLKSCFASIVSSLLSRSVWGYWRVTYSSSGARMEHLYAQVHASTQHIPELEAVVTLAISRTVQVFAGHNLTHYNLAKAAFPLGRKACEQACPWLSVLPCHDTTSLGLLVSGCPRCPANRGGRVTHF